MVTQWMIAGLTLLVVGVRPGSWWSAAAACLLATLDAGLLGDSALGAAVRAVAPMIVVLSVALGLTALAVRAGTVAWTAARLASGSRGSARRLFVLVCVLTTALTAIVTLDGAVVLMARVVVDLGRRWQAPTRALLLAVVAVANMFSLALPEGNPTNLVVIQQLGLALSGAATHTLAPGLTAALLCAALVAWQERASLAGRLNGPVGESRVTLRRAGLGGVVRITLQIVALLVVLLPVVRVGRIGGGGLWPLLAVAASVSALAALANNLPASALVAAALAPGPTAYAALVGLSVGALATPQGSVATVIAGDLAGEPAHGRVLLPAGLLAVLVAVLILWLT